MSVPDGVTTSSSGGTSVVRLNVGGLRFQTTVWTLRRVADTMLERMFSEDWAAHGCTNDEEGAPEKFIDRDGRHFHVVLNFLRDGPSVVLPDDTTALKEIAREAEVPTTTSTCVSFITMYLLFYFVFWK